MGGGSSRDFLSIRLEIPSFSCFCSEPGGDESSQVISRTRDIHDHHPVIGNPAIRRHFRFLRERVAMNVRNVLSARRLYMATFHLPLVHWKNRHFRQFSGGIGRSFVLHQGITDHDQPRSRRRIVKGRSGGRRHRDFPARDNSGAMSILHGWFLSASSVAEEPKEELGTWKLSGNRG